MGCAMAEENSHLEDGDVTLYDAEGRVKMPAKAFPLGEVQPQPEPTAEERAAAERAVLAHPSGAEAKARAKAAKRRRPEGVGGP